MVRKTFEESFERLRDQSNTLAATQRSAENFDEIVEQRAALDRLRDEVTEARRDIVSRYEPPATEVVLPPRGYVHTKLIGKVGAALSVALLVLCGFAAVALVRQFTSSFPLEMEALSETIEPDRCRWQLDVSLRNSSELAVRVTRVDVILNRQVTALAAEPLPTIAPGATGQMMLTRSLTSEPGACPTSIDNIDHQNLIVHFTTSTVEFGAPVQTVSLGF